MMSRRETIAAVSYLNTIPFIYGIEHAGLLRADLLLSPPADNVTAFASGDADIALIPVGALPHLPEHKIITSFCLGTESVVRTVVITGNQPVEETRRLWLDSHSRTSVLLGRVLCEEHWGIRPEYLYLDDYSVLENPAPGDAFLLIGDKVFATEGRFAHSYDLAVHWNRMTGLPFVFAVWVARPEVARQTEEALQRSLEHGVRHIAESIREYGYDDKAYAYGYLTENINFILDRRKREALALFGEKARRFDRNTDPG